MISLVYQKKKSAISEKKRVFTEKSEFSFASPVFAEKNLV